MRLRTPTFDIAYIADFRSPDAAQIANEIHVHVRQGYTTLLVPLQNARRHAGLVPAPEIITSVRAGHAHYASPSTCRGRCRVAVLTDFALPHVDAPWPLRIGHALVLIRWTDLVAAGPECLNLKAKLDDVRERLCCPVELVPENSRIRSALRAGSVNLPVADFDWSPVILDTSSPAQPRARHTPVAGRYAPPVRAHWPSDSFRLMTCYPVCDDIDIVLLGLPHHLHEAFSERFPANWTVFKERWLSVDRFLQRLDYFVPPRDPRWSHAPIDWRTLRAMGEGIVPILPKALRDDFEDAAVYATDPVSIRETAALNYRERHQFEAQRARARTFALDQSSPHNHCDRLRHVIGKPRRIRSYASVSPPPTPRGTDTVPLLFVATNGIGMGHLAQLLAIARRLPRGIKPIFVTNSQAIAPVRRLGYMVHYLPDDKYTKTRPNDWNDWLERELSMLVSLYGARGMVFDGVWCFDGLLRAAARERDFYTAWVRIPMWKRPVWDQSTDRANYFDMTIDVGELAQADNRGARIPYSERHHVVRPVLLCEKNELLSRTQARQQLGIGIDEPAVMLQLGSGNNWSLNPVIVTLYDKLKTNGVGQIVNAEWLISDCPAAVPGIPVLRTFPVSRFLSAFDFVVSAVGYNAFHELVAYGVPTIFIPNENQATDDQLGRAQFAESAGLGYCIRESELDRLDIILPELLDPAIRERIGSDCVMTFPGNGAGDAAKLIASGVMDNPANAETEIGNVPLEGDAQPAWT